MISRRRFHRVFRQGIWRTVRSARQGAPWLADLRAELLRCPAGKHDGQFDALGLVGQLVDTISAGPRPSPPEVTELEGYPPTRSKSRTTVRGGSAAPKHI